MNERNTKLKLAYDFVANTHYSVYLTGKAGTGKTTFLHTLRESLPKRILVTAPTGVAAINARGVTLHSFFQLPFGPFIPNSTVVNRRFSREKINIIKSLHLLIIDEISMVRADILDAVDSVLRRYRRSNEPFGGVQLLMIGDLHQLPPVIKPEEQAILQNTYSSLYFFGSLALQKAHYISIELDHIYRQSDPRFIDLLNRVRNNTVRIEDLQLLNARCQTNDQSTSKDLPITLSTHNATADNINRQQLNGLNTQAFSFLAEIDEDYPKHAYPTDETLSLKQGAQVMFSRNDSSPDKRYFNGKIGTVVKISQHNIQVKCPDDSEPIDVKPATWENITYHMDDDNNIVEKVEGTFTQYPLRLAWAITIHKSQGLTFDRVTLDMNAAFAHGQIYVAMSRCKSLEGINLYQPIDTAAIKTDEAIAHFTQQAQDHAPTQEQLVQAKIHYQQQLMLECFRFNRLGYNLSQLNQIFNNNAQSIRYNAGKTVEDIQTYIQKSVLTVSQKFEKQLQHLFTHQVGQQKPVKEPIKDALIQERIQKASQYFLPLLHELHDWQASLSFDSDNKAFMKDTNKQLQFLQENLNVYIAGVASCQQIFSTKAYLSAISTASLAAKPTKPANAKIADDWSADDLEHPELFQRLKNWRDKTAEKLQIARPTVIHLRTLCQITKELPLNRTMMRGIRGIGKKTIDHYSDDILAIVSQYCRDRGMDIEANINAFKAERRAGAETQQSSNTKDISYQLFTEGKTIDEIATERGMVANTILGHLAHFVAQGTLEPAQFIETEKIPIIETTLKEHAQEGFKTVKNILGDDYTYGDIKIVQAYLTCQMESNES